MIKPQPVQTNTTSPNNSLILVNVSKQENDRLNNKDSMALQKKKAQISHENKQQHNKSRYQSVPLKSRYDNPMSYNSSNNKPRYVSAPFNKKDNDSKEEVASLSNNLSSKSCFPTTYGHAGYLDVRTGSKKQWKRRYFVVNNNFLLSAATPHAQKLERMICLEGSKLSKHLKSSDMTFELYVRKHKLYFRTASPKQCETWTKAIERASKLKIKDIYRFLYNLGEGQANVKVIAAKHKTTNEDCAIKIVDKRRCDKKMLRTEIQILKKIESPYIVSIYDLIETKKYLYVVMEKCEGGELFDRIAELDGDGFSEQDTCLIMHQLCHAVKYMNNKGIVHRDLKPENILCTKPNCIKSIKICDFGISKMLKNIRAHKTMNTLCGTISYTAPEVLKQKRSYDYTVDYWSIGVIMYILCCGYPPFYGENDLEIEKSIISDQIEFEAEDWQHISNETRNLVSGLLNKIPRKRLCPDDVLKLTWKVSAKSVSFKRSHSRFKQTVLKSKIQRHSLSKFEVDSFISRKMFIHKPKTFDEEKKDSMFLALRDSRKRSIKRTSRISQKNWIEMNILRSKDDMNMHKTDQHSVEKYEKRLAAFRGNRRSKGTEELLQLKLPLSWSYSPLPTIDASDEPYDE